MPQNCRTSLGADKLAQLVSTLTSASSVPEIYRQSAAILLDKNVLNCKAVTFYARTNGSYKVAYATGKSSKPISPKTRPSLAKLIDGEIPYLPTGKQGLILPIRTNTRMTGLMRLDCQPRSCLLNGKSKSAIGRAKWLTLHAISSMIASSIENLRIHQKLKRQSIIDPLTRVYNRGHFDRQGKIELLRAKRYNKKIAYILIDIDNLKDINDEFGHMEGDHVLKSIGRILKHNCRQIDLVCRYGGDEFVIVLQETGRKDAMRKAEALHKEMLNLSMKPGHKKTTMPITTSIGVAAISKGLNNHATLFRAADKALYQAKLSGKNRCCCYK